MSEVKYEKALTVRSLLIGLVSVLVVGFVANFYYGRGGWAAFPPLSQPTLFALAYLFALGLLFRNRLTPPEYVVIYIMVILGFVGPFVSDVFLLGPAFTITALNPWRGFIGALVPAVWTPPLATITPMLAGGAPVPWGEWASPLGYWYLYSLMLMLFPTFFLLLVRRHTVEFERLPFAHTQVLTVTPGITPFEKGEWKQRFGKLVIVGTVVGFLIQSYVLSLWNKLWPVMPATGPLIINLTPMLEDSLPVAALGFGTDFITIAFLMLCPTDFLFTYVITMVIWDLIIVPMEAKMGMLVYIRGLASGSYWISGVNGGVEQGLKRASTWELPPAIQFGAIKWGMMFMFPIVILFMARKGLLESLKSMVKGKVEDIIVWTGLILTLIIFIGLNVVASIPLGGALAIVGIELASVFTIMRMRGEAMAMMGPGYADVAVDTHFGGPDFVFMGAGSLDAVRRTTAGVAIGNIMPAITFWVGLKRSAPVVMEGMKLGNDKKADWKGILIAAIIAIAVGLLLGYIVTLWGVYTWGLQKGWPTGFWEYFADDWWCTMYNVVYPNIGYGFSMIYVIIGAVFMAVIWILKMNIAAFPISPLGIIMTWSWWQSGLFISILIALILRVLVFRIGGAELFEKKTIPIIMGTILGGVIGNIANFILLATRLA